ncbi:MAG: selenide, water dikinase SelD [Bacteroidia bacterium]
MTEEKIFRLTQFSRGAGCGCKIAPEVLTKILHNNQIGFDNHKLLVGNNTHDDAAVFDLDNNNALISTTDFFMPVVDDAFEFGRIAATNAISDVYAMGGNPIMAVAILGWPVDKLPPELAQQVIAGGRSICGEAGIPLAGGHSVESAEPFFGLAVNGLVKKENIKRNNTAHAGDLLFITKPLGLGIITTAAKRNEVKEEDLAEAITYMTTLNKIGTELGKLKGVTALTDITGFGLLGHLIEMAEGSGCSAEIYFDKLPILKSIDYYLEKFIFPDMTTKNFSAYSGKVNELSARQLFITCDPQTSGGLLVAVNPASLDDYLNLVKENNLETLASIQIGKIIAKTTPLVSII